MGVKERKAREFKRRGEEILTAAYQFLADMEPFQMTMESIAESAEIGRGTIYKHFKSKDEIYAHLILRRRNILLERLVKIDREKEDPFPKLIQSYMEYCLDDPVAFAIHKRCENHCHYNKLNDELNDAIKDQQRRKIELVDKILNRSFNGSGTDSDTSLYQICAGWGMLRGAIDAMLEERFKSPEIDKEVYYQTVRNMLMKLRD